MVAALKFYVEKVHEVLVQFHSLVEGNRKVYKTKSKESPSQAVYLPFSPLLYFVPAVQLRHCSIATADLY